ncbi:hypothetical protein GEMRC1_001777 [Eukaryota sp. GEM-RC1]
MFFAHQILSKKKQNTLIYAWKAAHVFKKLTKKDVTSSDLILIIKEIKHQDVGLRFRAQLLLGTCRIYKRKSEYLLSEIEQAETLLKPRSHRSNKNKSHPPLLQTLQLGQI